MLASAADTELFAAAPEAAPDHIAEELRAALHGDRFAVEGPRAGCWAVRFIGEHTARNTERDALHSAAETAQRMGYEALLCRDERGMFVRVTRGRWFAVEEEPHHDECECPDCMPEEGPAEKLAGQSDRVAA